jgi:hypothetical protein
MYWLPQDENGHTSLNEMDLLTALNPGTPGPDEAYEANST